MTDGGGGGTTGHYGAWTGRPPPEVQGGPITQARLSSRRAQGDIIVARWLLASRASTRSSICCGSGCIDADALNSSELHSFKVLMTDRANVVADGWYWDAFEELKAQGHLHTSSSLGNGGDAFARLSADGRMYLRTIADST